MYRTSNNYHTFICLLLIAGFTVIGMQQDETTANSSKANGEQLERQMWKAMAENDMAWIERHIAEGFQSIHTDGARDRQEEIALISELNLGEYTFEKFESTKNGNTITVTYHVSVSETIEGERTNTSFAPRLSVWVQRDNTWKWVAHANLKVLTTGSEN